jgi:hypothetical protein
MIYTFHIPYTGPQWGFYLKPMQYPVNMPTGQTTDDEVLFTYGAGNLTSSQINQMSTEDLAKVKTQLERLRNDVKSFNDQLPAMIRIYAGQKHAAALRQTTEASAIKWPIRTRQNATIPPAAPITWKKVVPRPSTPTPGAQPELMESHYKQILEIIQNCQLLWSAARPLSPSLRKHSTSWRLSRRGPYMTCAGRCAPDWDVWAYARTSLSAC